MPAAFPQELESQQPENIRVEFDNGGGMVSPEQLDASRPATPEELVALSGEVGLVGFYLNQVRSTQGFSTPGTDPYTDGRDYAHRIGELN